MQEKNKMEVPLIQQIPKKSFTDTSFFDDFNFSRNKFFILIIDKLFFNNIFLFNTSSVLFCCKYWTQTQTHCSNVNTHSQP